MTARVLAVLTGLVLLAGCTSSGSPGGSPRNPGQLVPTGKPSLQNANPTHIREVAARSCPLASATSVRNTMGMRLGRITRLKALGISGCRFYALQGSSLHTSEHLPGPKQPVLEIVTDRYPTAVEAHNGVVLTARSGHNPQRVMVGKLEGACFQTDFYPKDHGQDWACAANKQRITVVVRSVDTTGTFGTATILRAVLRRV